MDKNNSKTTLKKVVIIGGVALVVLTSGVIIGTNITRTNKINNQALNYVNIDEHSTTIYCSGKNVSLSDEVYNKINEENLDLIIMNEKYILKIDNKKVQKRFTIDINVEKIDLNEEGYSIVVNTEGVKELKLHLDTNKKYFSEFIGDEFISNKVKIEDGYAKLKLKDNTNSYTLTYIIPSEFKLEDIKMNKGTSKTIELGIDSADYTFGSIDIVCSDEKAIEIDGFSIVAKEVGDYTIIAKIETGDKEAKLTIEPSVEKIEFNKPNLELIAGNSETVELTISPDNAVNKELEWISSDENIVTVENGVVKAIKEGKCEIEVITKDEPKVSAKLQVEVNARISYVSQSSSSVVGQVQGITYINGIMLVNKTHPIPRDYAPGLQSVAYNAFLQLRAAAAQEGHDIQLLSGYRSYDLQESLYTNYCNVYGQAAADTFSAKPGTSEHQTGLAMDVGWIDDAYADTPSGKWLASNCHKYGFIIRYMKNKESITGYKYEPWHIRYLGVDIATDVYNSGLCLEEYLGVLN